MKKLLVLWIIFGLVVCVGPLAGDTSEGESNVFAIDNTQSGGWELPAGQTAGASNPYTGGTYGDLIRGQIHSHFINDGPSRLYPEAHMTPESVAEHYRSNGYEFVSITEHDYVATAPSATGILSPPGCEEVSTGYTASRWDWNSQYCHILALGMRDEQPGLEIPRQPQYEDYLPDNGKLEIECGPSNTLASRRQMLQSIRSRGGLAVIPHPDAINTIGLIKEVALWLSHPSLALMYPQYAGNSDGSNFTLNQLRDLVGSYDGIALFNAAIPGITGLNDASNKWERLLDWQLRVWGFAEDDFTPGPAPTAGRTWVGVPRPSGSWDWTYIKNKLATGNFYSYWTKGDPWPSDQIPPDMTITVADGDNGRPNITVHLHSVPDTTPPNTTKYLSFIGKKWGFFQALSTYIPHNGDYTYQCGGKEKFVRVLLEIPYDFGTARGTLCVASQPIMVYPEGSYSEPYGLKVMTPEGLAISDTSSELELRYAEPEERPVTPPPAGYIGNIFVVSTDTGTVPPGALLELSFDGEDTYPMGGTEHLAIYTYDAAISSWVKVGGIVDPGSATIEVQINVVGVYTISADLPADTSAPEVFIDNPPFGGVVNADTQVRATVNDELGPWKVSVFMNGHPLDMDTVSFDGWSVNLPVADYCTGEWTLRAIAEDLAGNRGEAEIPIYINSTTPRPTISITSPGEGANLSGTATVTGTCGDDVAVAAVTVHADGTLVGFGLLDGSGVWSAEIDTTYLADGARTLRAVVEDYPGNEAEATVSVNLSNGSVSIGSIRGTADGQTVRLGTAVVTEGTAEMGGAFYIEAADRSAGIRVATDKVVPEGAQVSVAGVIGTPNGEREITASDVFIASTGNQLPDPLGTIGRSFTVGLDNTGLLVKVWGTITAAPEGAGYFYVDDGSALNDGSGNVGIKVYGTPPAAPVGKRVSVTGLSGAELSGTTTIPVIRTRRAADVAGVSGG